MSGMVQNSDGSWSEPPGYALLWGYFGCSRASWITLPRSLMHEMPDKWQARMAVLLTQFDEVYLSVPQYETSVTLKRGGKFQAMPDWLAYRHSDVELINSFKKAHASTN